MIFATIFNFFCLITVLGFSYVSKKIFYKKEIQIFNIDIFYGFFLLFLLSIFLNFFFPLKLFYIPIFVIGIFVFFKNKKKININFSKYFILIFFLTVFSFYNGNNVDSPMYHLQLIKWMQIDKIEFGISNLEVRFGMNSSWHSIVSFLDFKFFEFSLKYYLNILALSILIYEILNKKTNFSSGNLLIFLSVNYLLIFSFIHPFKNGVILNHLTNPETDIFAMVIMIFVFSIFLNLSDKNYNDNNLINLILITSFFAITSRFANLPILLFIFLIYFKIGFKNIFTKTNYLIIFSTTLWLFRSFFVSGCLIFPISATCLNTSWALSKEKVEFHLNEAMSLARDAPLKTRHTDFDYTLNSNEWIIPWIKNYLMETALLQISIILTFIFLMFLIVKNYKRIISLNLKILTPISVLFFSFMIWFKAPEIRFAWGIIIILPSLLGVYLIKSFNLNKYSNIKNYFGFFTILPILLLVYKNHNYFDYTDLIKINNKKFNYSQIYKFDNVNNQDIYKSQNWQCADFSEICVNIKKNFLIEEKFGYKFYTLK